MKGRAVNALIIANGSLPRPSIVGGLVRRARLIVCADGGASHARRLGITPDVILGDLDSLSDASRRFFRRVPVVFDEDQDSTDLEKAIEFCIRRKFRSIDAVGVFGSRIDHATGSLGCLKKFSPRAELTLYDLEGSVSLIRGRERLHAAKEEKLSLIPLERCEGVTTKNLRYPLKDDVLELGVREGISNEATASSVEVRLRRGTLLLYRFYPPDPRHRRPGGRGRPA